MKVANARRTDPATSHEAAASVNTVACRLAIIDAARRTTIPWTAEDMEGWLRGRYTASCVRGRIADLKRDRLLVFTGHVHNDRNRKVRLWRLQEGAHR